MEARFETFTVLINRISRNIRRIKNQEMAEYNLRSAHVSCLYYIYMSPGLTSTELCERCEEDKATISRAVEYLEENGYIVCNSKSAKKYKCPMLVTVSKTLEELTHRENAKVMAVSDTALAKAIIVNSEKDFIAVN